MSRADVVVVGAGLAGLTCGRQLQRYGHSVVVLEARDRVGGRVHSTELGGQVIELGGQYLGPGQDRAYALAEELSLATYRAHSDGDQLLETASGRVRRYHGTVPRLNPLCLLDVAQGQRRFERLVRRIDPAAPWDSRGAERHDRQTLATWIARNMRTRAGRQLFTLACQAVWSADPQDLSLLHALFYASAAGSLQVLLDSDGGAQQDRIAGGAHLLATGLADQLAERVQLEQPVQQIRHDADRVEVTTTHGIAWSAQHVVVAVPPALAARIRYDPPLPAARDALTQRLPMGSVVKCMALYETPFWRERGLSGQAITLRGPMSAVFDSTAEAAGPGILLAFIEAAAAREHSRAEPDERRAHVLDAFARVFGPEAARPTGYVEHDWTAEPYSRGGYNALFTPGTWTALGPALRESVGRIHWTGAETATRWYGYIDGAIRSGEGTAQRVSRTLRAG